MAKRDYLMEAANRLMGATLSEQNEFDKQYVSDMEDEEEVVEATEDEIVTDIDTDEIEGDVETDETEEVETITVEDALKAIRLVIDGTCETPEEAIEMVKAESGEDTEEVVDGEELPTDGELEVEVEGCGEKETLGESLFLKYASKFL